MTYSSGRASSTAGGVSATATKKTSGEEVYAGAGIHEAGYDDYTWGPKNTYVDRT